MESALNEQLFCRGFKDRQSYKRVGNFALKLASVDKHHITPTIDNAQKIITRYNENLFIFKKRTFKFDNKKYKTVYLFWKSIFDFLILTRKDENVDTSLSLSRGIYPNNDLLFLSIKFPFLRENNFNIVNPMLFDVNKRPQFGLNNSYILQFHDCQSCIKYLKHLWPINNNNDNEDGLNTFEVNCIGVKCNNSFFLL